MGVLTPQKVTFHADVKNLVDHILPKIFEMWKTEDDKWVTVRSLHPSLAG